MFLFRVLGIILVAIVVSVVPDVGANRGWVIGLLMGVHMPLALWMHAKLNNHLLSWLEPLVDLLVCISLIHLIPAYWHTGLAIALMVSLAPSISSQDSSHRYYMLFGVVLIAGFSLAGYVHDVPGWGVTMLAVTAVLPAVLFYAYIQAYRAHQLQKRAQALANLNQVAGGVAHDFNNILTGVLGYAELALEDIADDDPAKPSLEEVVRGAKRASLLSAQLLAFSRHGIKADNEMALGSELRIIANLLKPTLPKNVTLSLDIAEQLPTVAGDRGQLQQVLMNLIMNAAEACEHPPCEVSISMHPDATNGDNLRLEIRDQGKGISEENMPKIFDPSFTTKIRDYGLGLASAKHVIETHGGSINLQSDPGRGTLVTIVLPGKVRTPIDETPSPTPKVRPDRHILVIEDDPSVREVIEKLLGSLGITALLAESGPVGLSYLEDPHSQVDSVILDLNMPGMGGWECLAKIRQFKTNLPVLICSGYNPEQSPLPEATSNVDFLQKPFTLEKLRAALSS